MRRKARTIRLLGRGIGLTSLGMALLFGWLMWRVNGAQAGTFGDGAAPVDAIIVLGATVRADGTPGPDLRSRTWWAVDLYHTLVAQGQSPILITTGGDPGDWYAASTVAAEMAQRRGVPADQIVQAGGGQTTEEDMRFAAQTMQRHGWQQAILVSHPLHLYRSRWHFQRLSDLAVETYPAGGITYLSTNQRLTLDAREAAGILWASVNGWEHMTGLGRWLEAIVYG